MKRLSLKPGTVERSRELRRDATDAEKRMWRALRDAFPEAKFRRQVPLGPYFADFCSHTARLVIEVDGGQHAETTGYDAARTRFLEAQGYRVLRFWNNDVLANTEGVLAVIDQSLSPCERGLGEGPAASAAEETLSSTNDTSALQTQRAPHPLPSPTRGEGEFDKITDFGVR